MNYIVDDDFDFYGELNDFTNTPVHDVSNICMVSHQQLTYNAITLACKHSFNYMPLYNELCLHNNKQYISCPYCRAKSDKLIPFIPLPNVNKVYGVNYPPKISLPVPKCSFIIKIGMYKGLACEHNGIEYEHGIFCAKHAKNDIDSVWTLEKVKLSKSKSVPELKQMLREKGLKVSGVKKDLVNRLFSI